jgi:NADH dehydrogenase
MRVLVAGATGMVGSEVVRLLTSMGATVRGLIRATSNPEKVAALKEFGAEIAVGDFLDADSLKDACEDMDVVISTVSAMPFSWSEESMIGDVDRDGTIRLIDSARAADARRFVYLSFPHGPNPGFVLGDAKAAVESYLTESGLEYCVLAANFFMEVWLSPAFGFDYGAATATIYGDGSNACNWVSVKDVARNVVQAATTDPSPDAVVPCGGPEALSPAEVVSVFEEADNRTWRVEYVPVETLQAILKAATDEFQASVAMLQLAYAGAPFKMDARDFLVRDGLTSVAEYARSVLPHKSEV